MTAAPFRPVSFLFQSKAIDPDTFDVIAFSGREEISRPYRFDIKLVANDPDIDMESMLYHPVTLSIEKGDGVRKIHGVLDECMLSDALPDNRYGYQVVLKPRIWLLSMNRQNQIYQELSVPDIVVEEIKSSTAKDGTRSAAAGLTSDDFELRLTRNYSQREYVVQYGESDLNFISRLMEHEGIFYYFEQGDDKEKLIISDNNIHFGAREKAEPIAYRPVSALARPEDEAVLSLNATFRRVPRKLVLKDYNYRMPHIMLQAEADVDDKSNGLVARYGDHFKTPEEGDIMARIRSQEISCTKHTFKGSSNSIGLAPGLRFKLDEHFRDDVNAEYVVTTIEHSGRQPVEGTAGLNKDGNDAADYRNTFSCIPSHVDFRPPRQTPKPVVSGLMNAHVDAALLENRAEIDGQGRYKLIMPFDLSGAAAGKASRYVRKAQPYGGKDMGMHFPLYKGTEVICTFINGDPDRPIITGVVPNPLTASVVTDDNYTKNIVKTGHGSYFEFNDGKGPATKSREMVSSEGVMAAQQQQQPIKMKSGTPVMSERSEGRSTETFQRRRFLRNPSVLQRQQQQQPLDTARESDSTGTDDVWFRVDVPDYDTATSRTDPKASYLRMGIAPEDEAYMADSASKEKTESYTVAKDDQNVRINCTEGVRYTVIPNIISDVIRNPRYGKMFDTWNVTLNPNGNIEVTVGFNQAGSKSLYTTEILVLYDDANGNTGETKTTITWNVQDGGEAVADGWFDFTDGNHTSVAMGDRKEVTHGKYKQKIFTEDKKPFFYDATFDDLGVQRKVTLGHVFSYATQFGTKESYFAGLKFDGFLGGSTSLSLASTMKAAAGINLSANFDANIKLGHQWSLEMVNGKKAVVSKGNKLYGETIDLRIMNRNIKSSHAIWQMVVGLGATVLAGAEVASTVLSGIEMENDSNDPYETRQGNAGFSNVGSYVSWSSLGVAEIAKLVALILSVIDYKRINKQWELIDSNNGNPRVHMDDKEIHIRCGKAGVIFNKDGNVDVYGKTIHFAPSTSKQNVVNIDAKGLTVETGDLNVKTGKMTSKGDIETKSGRLKSRTFSSAPVPSTKTTKVGGKNRRIVRKLRKKLPGI